ncbi:MAG TPA: hypothetical protein VLV50_10795 [Stellaceae bacterium]|nr:hypothetical protein [Stellaceae bacterium]
MDPLTFYFDRCFGRRFPEALWRASPPFMVEFHHSDRCRFAQNMPDDEWLGEVGRRGWIAFSHDRRFHRDLPAVSAIKQHHLGCFYLWGAEISTWDKVRWFTRHVDKIIELSNRTERPFIYHVPQSGRPQRVLLS